MVASFGVPSPSTEAFPHEPAVIEGSKKGQAFEGFPDDLQELPTAHTNATLPEAQLHNTVNELSSPGIGLLSLGLSSTEDAFPSPGFGGRSGKRVLGSVIHILTHCTHWIL